MPIRSLFSIALGLLLFLLAGCQSTPTTAKALPPLAELQQQIDRGDYAQVQAYTSRWLEQADALERLQRLEELEAQALQLWDLPVRLGAYGSSLVDLYGGSLLGHIALARHYDALGHKESADAETTIVNAIISGSGGDGSRDHPFHAVSASEGEAFIRQQGQTSAGAIYTMPAEDRLELVVMAAQRDGDRLRDVHFDLSQAFVRAAQARSEQTPDKPFTSRDWIAERASGDDTAASVALAIELIQSQPRRAYDLLLRSVARGNVFARLALAQAYLSGAGAAQEPAQRETAINRAIEQLEQSATAGSDIALVQLARVHYAGLSGKDHESEVVPLLEKAVAMGNDTAPLLLAQVYLEGRAATKDKDKAMAVLAKAASAGNTDAKFAYAQLQVRPESETPTANPQVAPTLDAQGKQWLAELADNNHAAAVMLLANLRARGLALPVDIDGAKSLLKRAAHDSDDIELKNNVAWALAVSDIEQLRDAKLALSIMTTMMEKNAVAAQRAAYMDTWAACFAATGRWDKAISTQKRAIQLVEASDQEGRDELLKVLNAHLEAFQRKETITEQAP